MALPTGLATAVVTVGPYLTADGTPAAGTVRFVPEGRVLHAPTGSVILPDGATVTLDGGGAGQVTLAASDADGVIPNPFAYWVYWELPGRSSPEPRRVFLPAGTVDVDALLPSTSATGAIAVPAVSSVAGLSGAVSAAQLAAVATLGTLGQASARWPMLNLGKKMRTIRDGTPGRVKWLTLGDSYAQKIAQAMAPLMFNAFGPVAGTYFSGASATNGITVNSQSGTVTDNNSDFTAWPSGQTMTFAAGASRTFGQGGGLFVGDTIRVFWINNGAGTFKVQVDGVDNSTPTVTSDGGLGVATISVARGEHTVTVVGLTGSAKVIGVGYEDSTASGTCFVNVSQGGIALNSPSAQAWANFGTFLAAVAPDVLTWEGKEDSSYLATALDTALNTVQAAAPHTDVVLIQSPPQSTADADNVTQNGIIAARAAAHGVLAWDSYTPFRNWATLNALGWGGDGTHVLEAADAYRGGLMFRDLGIFEIAETQPYSPQASVLTSTATIRLGKNPAAPVLRHDADLSTDLDVTSQVKRIWRFTDTAGGTLATFDSRGDAGHPSQLPHYSQLGAGMSGLAGETTDIASVRRWGGGNLNGWGDLGVRSLISAVAPDVTGSGAITLDLTAGCIFQVWMTGNVTSWAIANPSWGGQEVEVHFIQTGGGNTLTGSAGAIHLAGTLTLSGGAGKRDIVRFRQISGSFYEISRTLGL